MKNTTRKQHWVPQFIIRKWTNNKNEYKFYDTHNKRYSSVNLADFEDSKNDIFYHNWFYENQEFFEINEIEKGLSKIESDFANILQKKIITKNNKVVINRLDSKIIKLYWLIENYRSWVTPQRAYNLQGDSIYNNFYKDKTKEEIDQEFLKNLHYLVFDMFDYIKSNIGFLPKKLENEYLKQMEGISKLLEKYQPKTLIEAKLLVEQYPNEFSKFSVKKILNNSISIFINSCLKIIKINENISYNFLLTDCRHVQFFDKSYSKLFGWTILELMPISPRYAIAFLRLNEMDKSQPSVYAKNSLWDLKFPGLFEVNHKVKLKHHHHLFSELKIKLSTMSKEEQNELNTALLHNSLLNKYLTNEDLYYYSVYELTNNEQVHLINGMLHSQTYKYVAYLKGKDLLKAIETIELYDIFRIEEKR